MKIDEHPGQHNTCQPGKNFLLPITSGCGIFRLKLDAFVKSHEIDGTVKASYSRQAKPE